MKVKELAQKLNLSPSTVSLVLNDRPGISEATREKVIKAVIELGCEDMFSGRGGVKRTILFVVYRKNAAREDSSQTFSELFSEIIEGVENQAKKRDFQLMLSYMDRQSFQEELLRIRGLKADGVILLATEMEEKQLDVFMELNMPLVVLDNYTCKKNYDCVTINNEQGVYEAVSYLKEMGHNRIGYFHIVKNANNFRDRYFGFFIAMEQMNIPIEKKYIVEFDTDGGESLQDEILKKLKSLKEMPSAFFADNDILAISAIQSLKRLGYQIPQDISVIGFDNMPLSEILDPPLTTIQVQKRKMGIEAVNLLTDKMEETENKGNLRLEVSASLIVRQSVKRIR